MKKFIPLIIFIVLVIVCIYFLRDPYDTYRNEAKLLLLITSLFGLITSLINFRKSKLLNIFFLLLSILMLLVVFAREERSKSPYAAMKSTLANSRAIAALTFDENHSYQNFCTYPDTNKILEPIKGYTKSIKCFGDIDSFILAVEYKRPLPTETHYCVDSTGIPKAIDSAIYNLISDANSICGSK